MKVLVTGGAGFLGSHLVEALLERGDEVVVVDNLSRGHSRDLLGLFTAARITFREEDVRDYPGVLKAAAGAEIVYHLAAQSNVMGAVQDPDYSFTTNVFGTFNVLKAASALGIRRVIFASSREVYGEPDGLPVPEDAPLKPRNLYGAGKAAAEACCRAWQNEKNLDCIVLRLANLYGPRDRDRVIPLWLDLARRGEDLDLYGGQQVLDFLWVGYAVDALTAAANCPNTGPVNVASGCGVAILELARRILALTDGRSFIHRLPARNVDVVRFVADVTKMRLVLGIEPPTDPLQRLSSLVFGQNLRDQPHDPQVKSAPSRRAP